MSLPVVSNGLTGFANRHHKYGLLLLNRMKANATTLHYTVLDQLSTETPQYGHT